MKNPFTWLEIYVNDMPRAQKFYEEVLDIKMKPMLSAEDTADLEMLGFPWDPDGPNISGALCKTKYMQAGTGGTLAYFNCDDCVVELGRVVRAGGKLIKDKFQIGDFGFCGIAMDTEGNMIGFYSMK
ncbi:MAG: VOC family protein [Saprospiraceae bacterium]|nr:VOC family protein [Saprospiraceae bacterium]